MKSGVRIADRTMAARFFRKSLRECEKMGIDPKTGLSNKERLQKAKVTKHKH